MKYLFISLLSLYLVAGCEQSSPPPKKPKAISRLSESEAESLLQQCYEKVSQVQAEFANKVRGKSELITRHTDESYRAQVSSQSYQTIEQRLKAFRRYKSLNLNFSFWGSMPNAQGHYYRYVVIRYCSTNGLEITEVKHYPLVKLAR
jgi:hypothetical protein